MDDKSILTEPFSAGYELVPNAEIYTREQAEALMDIEMFGKLLKQFGEFIGMIGGIHYEFRPEAAVPGNSVILPERNHDDPTALLIQK